MSWDRTEVIQLKLASITFKRDKHALSVGEKKVSKHQQIHTWRFFSIVKGETEASYPP